MSAQSVVGTELLAGGEVDESPLPPLRRLPYGQRVGALHVGEIRAGGKHHRVDGPIHQPVEPARALQRVPGNEDATESGEAEN